VKRVTVRDVESSSSYYFLCESWLAVEQSDGKVEREFMALDGDNIGFTTVLQLPTPWLVIQKRFPVVIPHGHLFILFYEPLKPLFWSRRTQELLLTVWFGTIKT